MAWEYGKLFTNVEDFISYLKVNDKAKHPEIHMHHTYSPNHSNFTGNNHRALQDGMKRYHVNANGWADIAQHATVFPDGSIMTGRNVNMPPASATGYNDSDPDNIHPFMFETLGNFDKGHDKLEGKQLDTVIKLIRHFVKNEGSKLVFHRQCLINGREPKSCPGTGIDYNWILGLVNSTPPAPSEPMYDLSYLLDEDGGLKGVRSSKHPEELLPEIEKLMKAKANCIVLKKRDFDVIVKRP